MEHSSQVLDSQRAQYLRAALGGNLAGCAAVTDSLLEAGTSVLTIYQELLAPVQRTLGDLWGRGDIDVVQEHLATDVSLTLMSQLRVLLRSQQPAGHSVAIATVDGDYHFFGARLVADHFLADGWQVSFLGASVPAADLVRQVARQPVEVMALSVSVADALPSVAPAVRALRSLNPELGILLGGPAFPVAGQDAATFGVDGLVTSASDAVEQARALVGDAAQPLQFEEYLAHVGQRLRLLRSQKSWNQERLAEASGLDRTYISAVENGKQNLTLRALVALASALQVAPERLMSDRW